MRGYREKGKSELDEKRVEKGAEGREKEKRRQWKTELKVDWAERRTHAQEHCGGVRMERKLEEGGGDKRGG